MRTYCQILAAIYVYLDGCRRDNSCSKGKWCGTYVSKYNVSFDECEAHAIGLNADGFSYLSKYSDCYLCTNQQLASRRSVSNSGVYNKKTGKCTFMIIIHECMGGFIYIYIYTNIISKFL